MFAKDSAGRKISLLNNDEEPASAPRLSHSPAGEALKEHPESSNASFLPSPKIKRTPLPFITDHEPENIVQAFSEDKIPSTVYSHAPTYSDQDPLNAGNDKAFRFIDVAPDADPQEQAAHKKLVRKNAAHFGHQVGAAYQGFTPPWSPTKKPSRSGSTKRGSDGGKKEKGLSLQFVDVVPNMGVEERAAKKQLVRRNAAQYRWSQPQNTYRERKSNKPLRGILKPGYQTSEEDVPQQMVVERRGSEGVQEVTGSERVPQAMSVYSLIPGDTRVGRLLDSVCNLSLVLLDSSTNRMADIENVLENLQPKRTVRVARTKRHTSDLESF